MRVEKRQAERNTTADTSALCRIDILTGKVNFSKARGCYGPRTIRLLQGCQRASWLDRTILVHCGTDAAQRLRAIRSLSGVSWIMFVDTPANKSGLGRWGRLVARMSSRVPGRPYLRRLLVE